MATRLRLNSNEDVMSKGIIHPIGQLVKLENPARVERHNVSEEQPIVADLVLPGTGFSDEFTCLLRMLSGERDFA